MANLQSNIHPVPIFYSYAHADEDLKDKLEKHLSGLRQQGFISEWHDRQIVAGTDWAKAIDKHLNTASIILLLISPDFISSNYSYSIEMQRALERQRTGDAIVIPIILRPVDWQEAPFAHLQSLPRDAKPITTWQNQDEAFLNVATGIRHTIEKLLRSSSLSNHIPSIPGNNPVLSFQDKSSLVDKLLDCSSLRTKDTRETIVKQLPDRISDKIERHSTARFDIMSIVDTCLEYPGSLEELITITRFFEGNSISMKNLDNFLKTLFTTT